MNIFDLKNGLKQLDEYNRGLREKPNFKEDDLRRIRDYQLEQERLSLEELKEINWQN